MYLLTVRSGCSCIWCNRSVLCWGDRFELQGVARTKTLELDAFSGLFICDYFSIIKLCQPLRFFYHPIIMSREDEGCAFGFVHFEQELPITFPRYIVRNSEIKAFSEKDKYLFEQEFEAFRKSFTNSYDLYSAWQKKAWSKYDGRPFLVGGNTYTLRRPLGGDLRGKIYNGSLTFVHYYDDLSHGAIERSIRGRK